ncbi:MAG: EthD domain-containing protein [Gammaproteobacteria bacterium]|nr:EthD domain-containing protein [Gammaproteobacteria bacterium]NNM01661.1 EthD domain-containing protein [Gammaproteobacteria bacterium]
MIKLVMCIGRHPDMTRAQFQDYWLNQHGPFFRKNVGAMRARKYLQSHTLDTPFNEGLRASRGLQPEYDGVAEVWFDSEEDLQQALSTPEGEQLTAALRADEENFIDHANSAAFLVTEHEL